MTAALTTGRQQLHYRHRGPGAELRDRHPRELADRPQLRGGWDRAPGAYHTGTRCSRRMARLTAARSSANSSSVEEMNTRTRGSGVKITSVCAISSKASPQLPPWRRSCASSRRVPELARTATRPHNPQLMCSPTDQRLGREAAPAPRLGVLGDVRAAAVRAARHAIAAAGAKLRPRPGRRRLRRRPGGADPPPGWSGSGSAAPL